MKSEYFNDNLGNVKPGFFSNTEALDNYNWLIKFIYDNKDIIKELSKDISQVFLAIPSLEIKRKKDIINMALKIKISKNIRTKDQQQEKH